MKITVFDHNAAFKRELTDKDVIGAKLHEEINGEHSLTLTTTVEVEKGSRLVFKASDRFNDSKWREYVVTGVDEEHHIGTTVVRTYYCVWSLQEDLQCFLVSVMPGVSSQNGVLAQAALESLLSTQTRWTRGAIYNTNRAGASMYDRSAWDALSVLIENWGGEIDDYIAVDEASGVTYRKIDYYEKMGRNTKPQARFDFGYDVKSITRSQADGPYYCRISPRGKGEATENGGYGRKVTIESVNGGRDYLEYGQMRTAFRILNPDGTYIYPTLKVENSACETPAELMTWAEGVLQSYCTRQYTYSVDVYRASAGEGVVTRYDNLKLGDLVQVVDHTFGSTGSIEIEARVVAIDHDLFDRTKKVLRISAAKQSISSKFSNLGGTGGVNYSNPSAPNTIGGVEPASTTGINVADTTNVNVCSVSIPAGVWMVCGRVSYPVNSTGRRAAKLSTTSQDSANVLSTMVLPASDDNARTHVSTSRCFTLATQTTVYLIGYQTSGQTLSCNGDMECTRIG